MRTPRVRVRVQREWNSYKTPLAEGARIHHDFVKPHAALEGQAPAEGGGMGFGERAGGSPYCGAQSGERSERVEAGLGCRHRLRRLSGRRHRPRVIWRRHGCCSPIWDLCGVVHRRLFLRSGGRRVSVLRWNRLLGGISDWIPGRRRLIPKSSRHAERNSQLSRALCGTDGTEPA